MKKLLHIILVSLALVPLQVFAHGSGPPYLLVNGIYAETNPIQGLKPDELALDIVKETFVVGEPIEFEIDMKNLGFPAEVRWQWSQGSSWQEGAKARHAYDRPGSYLVKIQVKGEPTSNEFTDVNSIQINVAPQKEYSVAEPKVTVDFKESGGGWDTALRADASGTAKIRSYKWLFGDGAQAEGRTVRHNYAKGFYQAFPLLIVEDENGIKSYTAFEVSEADGKFRATSLQFFQNSVRQGAVTSFPAVIYFIIPPAFVLLISYVIFIRKRSK